MDRINCVSCLVNDTDLTGDTVAGGLGCAG
jgi:hypothetical protein